MNTEPQQLHDTQSCNFCTVTNTHGLKCNTEETNFQAKHCCLQSHNPSENNTLYHLNKHKFLQVMPVNSLKFHFCLVNKLTLHAASFHINKTNKQSNKQLYLPTCEPIYTVSQKNCTRKAGRHKFCYFPNTKKFRNIRFVGNFILHKSCEFYYDDVIMTSFIRNK